MSSSSDLQKSLFDTMKIFTDFATDNSDATITIEAKIADVIDEGIGEYRIEYYSNIIPAFSNGDTTYSVGDNVYVLVPDGDFEKKKIILGKTSTSIDAINIVSNEDKYFDVTENLIDKDIDIIKLSSYEVTESAEIELTNHSATNFGNLINEYLKDYRNLSFSFKVLTSLAFEQQAQGNYGISLKIPLTAATALGERERIWKTVILDTANMQGNPYRLEAWAIQKVFLSIDEQYEYDVTRKPVFSYFCYGFPQDSSKVDIKDIWFKDLSLAFVKEFSEEDKTGYSLTLKSTQGEYFSEFYDSTKTITPTLRAKGKTTNLKNAEIYWFKEDSSVLNGNINYNVYGGSGWRCLNAKENISIDEEGNETFNYITSIQALEVKRAEVLATMRYKCVVVVNKTTISAIITLKNLNSNLDFSLVSRSDSYIKDTGNVEITARIKYGDITSLEKNRSNIKYTWSRYDKNGSLIKDEDNFFEVVKLNEVQDGSFVTIVKYPVNMVEDANIVYCNAKNYYLDNGSVIEEDLGTRAVNISTSSEYVYNLNITGDDVIYKYDANGDSPAGTAYDGPSTSKVTSIEALGYTLFKANGEELTEDEYKSVKYTWKVKRKGMISIKSFSSKDDNYWYLTGYGNNEKLAYTIASRFNVAQMNTEVILEVDFKGVILTRNASINFIKEGMNGSNGTAYSARLVAGGDTAATSVPYGTLNSNGVPQKLKLIYNTSNNTLFYYDYNTNSLVNWGAKQRRIFVRVWENSEELDSSAYNVEYSIFDSKHTNPAFAIQTGGQGILPVLSNGSGLTSGITIVQAKVTVKRQSSVTNQDEVIYCYYPIETIVTRTADLIPDLRGGFSEVMYAADGTNPSYDETSNFSVVDSDGGNYFSVNWETAGHLIPSGNSTLSSIKIKPTNKYDDGVTLNYVKAIIRVDGTQVATIRSRISELQSEVSKLEVNKNTINSDNEAMLNFCKAFNYTTWNNTLNELQPLLSKELSYFNRLTVLKNTLIPKLEEYIGMKNQPTTFNSLTKSLETLKESIEANLIILPKADGTESHRLKNLLSLTNNSLVVTEQISEEIGISSLVTLKFLVEDINQQIASSEVVRNDLLKLAGKDYETRYRELLASISATISLLTDAYDFKSKCLTYLDKINSIIGLKDKKAAITSMYNEVLASFFSLEDNKLSIANTLSTGVQNKIADIDSQISSKRETINYLSRVQNTSGAQYTYIRPIVMYYNRYGMSNINAWDGSKIETGDGAYLLAPQVGAGVKEADNSFTGMVMGLKNFENDSKTLKGLFGYHKGVQSFQLNAEDGSAVFGKTNTGGQIIVDPNNSDALLYSSSFFKEYDKYSNLPKTYKESNYSGKGMMINLSKPEIRYGSGNFLVNANGEMTATNATLTGKIYSTEGDIGGWKINSTGLKNGNITLTSNGIDIGGRCKLNADGSVLFVYSNGESLSTSASGGLRTGDIRVAGTVNTDALKINGTSIMSIIDDKINSKLSGYATTGYVNSTVAAAIASVSK